MSRSVLAILVFVGALDHVYAGLPTEGWLIRPFHSPQELPYEVVRGIDHSPDGRKVWFATWGGGIACLEGAEWRTFSVEDGLPSNSIRAILADGNEGLWIGADAGIAYFDGTTFTRYSKASANGPPEDSIFCIRRMKNGEIWFGTSQNHVISPVSATAEQGSGDSKVHSWRTVVGPEVTRGESVRDILETPDGEIWLANSTNGVARFDGTGWRHYGKDDGLVLPIHALTQSRDGTLWAAGGYHVCRFDGERWVSVPEAGQETMAMAEVEDGRIFLGTLNGLRVFQNGAWSDFLLDYDNPNRQIEILYVDPQGTLWVGTRTGAYRVARPAWKDHTRAADGVALQPGSLVVGSGSPPLATDTLGRILRFEGEKWTVLEIPGLTREVPAYPTPPREGKVWLFQVPRAVEVSLETHAILQSVPIPTELIGSRLHQTRDGRLWLLSATGLYLLSGEQWLPMPEDPSYTRAATHCMEEAPNGDLWFGLDEGVEHWSQGSVETFPAQGAIFGGLPPVRAIHACRDGRILFASSSTGVIIRDGPRWERLSVEDGLFSHRVASVFETRDETLWVGYREAGVSSHRDGRWITHRYQDGVPIGKIENIWQDDSGMVWIDIERIGPYAYRHTSEPPNTRLLASPEEIPFGGVGVLSFTANDAWGETLGRDLLFSWRISPGRKDASSWSPYTSQTSLVTPELEPGRYLFEVRAEDKDRNADPTPATVWLTVAQPLWRSPEFLGPMFFLLAVAAVALGVGYSYHRDLRASEERHRTVVENASDAIVLVQDEKVRYSNRQFLDLVGAPLGDVLGGPILRFFHPDERERVSDIYSRRIRGEQIQSRYESRLIDKSGRKVDIEVNAALVPFEGRIADLVLIRDITARKEAEEGLLQRSRLEATATLAGGIAHDFNNLMVGVLGYAELARMDVTDQPETVEMLERIIQSAQRAGSLAQQMLAFAQGGKYVPKVLDLNRVVMETLDLVRASAPPGIVFEFSPNQEPAMMEADSSQLGQVVMNLCMNAVEAVGAHGQITLATDHVELKEGLRDRLDEIPPGRYVRLVVSDSGPGMDEETLSRLFEPFFTTKFHGRGLGLAAVYGIIRNHGGQLGVVSTPGQGARFTIHLPASRAEAPLQPPPAPIPRGGETILLVEDEDQVLRVERNILERLGYRTLTARNGQEAVHLAENYPEGIDLAILDMGMPIMDGPTAFPLLRQARPGMRVVVCSGFDARSEAESLLEAGASGFIQKPFTTKELALAIRAALAAEGGAMPTPDRAV